MNKCDLGYSFLPPPFSLLAPPPPFPTGLIRSYSDGRPWMAFFEDGSGSVFHPGGGVAINIIPWQRLNQAGDEIVKPRVWDKQRNSFVSQKGVKR